MKKFIYNEKQERTIKFIEEYEYILKEEFEEKYQFICDYPFVLNYPTYKTTKKVCESCGHIEYFNYSWEEGFRPDIEDVRIDLCRIAPILQESKYYIDELKDDYDEFFREFKKYF